MAGKIKNKVFYAMTCLTGLGLGLLLGGMFIGVVNSASDIPGVSGNISLFDEDFSTLGISNTFALLSFIVTIVGIIMICADLGLRNNLKAHTSAPHRKHCGYGGRRDSYSCFRHYSRRRRRGRDN